MGDKVGIRFLFIILNILLESCLLYQDFMVLKRKSD